MLPLQLIKTRFEIQTNTKIKTEKTSGGSVKVTGTKEEKNKMH